MLLDNNLQDSLPLDEGDLSEAGLSDPQPLEEASSGKVVKAKGESTAGRITAKKPKERKGEVKTGPKVQGSPRQRAEGQTTGNEIKRGPLKSSESPTLQEDFMPSSKQTVKKVLPKNPKPRAKADKRPSKKFSARSPIKGQGGTSASPHPPQRPLLHPPCSSSEMCHCVRWVNSKKLFGAMLERMAGLRCRPCLLSCCHNPAVRSGACCDPSTLGESPNTFRSWLVKMCEAHKVCL